MLFEKGLRKEGLFKEERIKQIRTIGTEKCKKDLVIERRSIKQTKEKGRVKTVKRYFTSPEAG